MGNKPFAKSSPVIVSKNTGTQRSSIFPRCTSPLSCLGVFSPRKAPSGTFATDIGGGREGEGNGESETGGTTKRSPHALTFLLDPRKEVHRRHHY